jgi:hypothetical protein
MITAVRGKLDCPNVLGTPRAVFCTRLALSSGLVARPYEPLADSHAGTHGPGQTRLLQSLQKTQPNPAERGLTLFSVT